MCHHSYFRKTESEHKCSKIIAVHIGCTIGRAFGTSVVWIIVSAAISDCTISLRKLRKMLAPHSIILETAVNEYDRFALPEFNISKLGAIGGDPLNIICHDHGADGPTKK